MDLSSVIRRVVTACVLPPSNPQWPIVLPVCALLLSPPGPGRLPRWSLEILCINGPKALLKSMANRCGLKLSSSELPLLRLRLGVN